MPIVVPRYESMQYTGNNGPAVLEWLCGSVDLVSDDGAELVVAFLGSQRHVPSGGWVIAAGGGNGLRNFLAEQTDADYKTGWRET
ncbi:hypothetical protein DF268_36055 [Streptomyces sp. V2]|uniref:hypothetical protein n=1 Tax=Streptomyces sp. V2 TaxID=1424099 RepID=UPI000D66C6B2|nr:hypothetical protein [Streptomyces sp. V2]PWG08786.1 hypothetical protein DF268_36055 [Streptomyces sp. V2]